MFSILPMTNPNCNFLNKNIFFCGMSMTYDLYLINKMFNYPIKPQHFPITIKS